MDDEIQNILHRYREREIDLNQLRAWLDSERARADAQVPRGEWLKLMRGSEAQSNGAIARLLPACMHCLGVGEPKKHSRHIRSISNTPIVATQPSQAASSPKFRSRIFLPKGPIRQVRSCTVAAPAAARSGHSSSPRKRNVVHGIESSVGSQKSCLWHPIRIKDLDIFSETTAWRSSQKKCPWAREFSEKLSSGCCPLPTTCLGGAWQQASAQKCVSDPTRLISMCHKCAYSVR